MRRHAGPARPEPAGGAGEQFRSPAHGLRLRPAVRGAVVPAERLSAPPARHLRVRQSRRRLLSLVFPLECGGSTPLSFFGRLLAFLSAPLPDRREKTDKERTKESGVEPPHSKDRQKTKESDVGPPHSARRTAGYFRSISSILWFRSSVTRTPSASFLIVRVSTRSLPACERC